MFGTLGFGLGLCLGFGLGSGLGLGLGSALIILGTLSRYYCAHSIDRPLARTLPLVFAGRAHRPVLRYPLETGNQDL